MTLFFNPRELTKIVLKSSHEILWSFIESSGLPNLTKKDFPLFPRNIQYREKLKGLPFSFLALWDFFSKKSPKGPLQVFDVLRQNGCWKIPKGPLQFFWHYETFFRKIVFSPKGPLSIFDILHQWMLKNPKGPPFSAPEARASGHLARQFGRLGFSGVWYSFREFDTLSFLTLSCPFAIFEP